MPTFKIKSAVRQFGNSSGIIIPKTILENFGLKRGDKVEIQATDSHLVIKKVRKK